MKPEAFKRIEAKLADIAERPGDTTAQIRALLPLLAGQSVYSHDGAWWHCTQGINSDIGPFPTMAAAVTAARIHYGVPNSEVIVGRRRPGDKEID